MNSRQYIRTNRVSVTLNRDVIDQKFDVFAILADNSVRGLPYKVIDNDYKACAVYYAGSGSFCYVMFDKGKVNLQTFRSQVETIDKNCKVSRVEVNTQSIPDLDLANLLLNSIKSDTDDDYGYNNLTGSLLYIIDKGKSKKKPSEVVTLKMNIDNSWCIFPTVQTYCRYSLEEIAKMEKDDKESKNKKVPFVIDKDGLFHKITKETKSKTLYLKKKRNPDSKNLVDYIVWRNFESFRKTKMGALYQMLTDVEKYLGKFMAVSFDERFIESDFIEKRESVVDLKKLAKQYELDCRVVDLTGENAEIVERLKKNYKKVTDKDLIESNEILKECANFVIVREKCDYAKAKETDKYIRNAENIVIQHITTRELEGKDAEKLELAWMKVLVKEILVKQDLRQGKISMEGWNQYGWTKQVSFAVRDILDAKKKIYQYKVMKVNPDGSFKLSRFAYPDCSKQTDLSEEEQSAIVNVWQEKNEARASEIEMAIYESIDHIYVIKRTTEHPILNVKTIGKHLQHYKATGEIDKKAVLAALEDFSEGTEEWKDNVRNLLEERTEITNEEFVKMLNLRTTAGQAFNYHLASIYGVIISPQVKSPVFDGLYEMGNMIGINTIKNYDAKLAQTQSYTYVVGEKNQGKIQFSLDRGCVFRQIYCANKKTIEESFVLKIIRMLQVEWITMDQYTVLPMVNKYLREM